MLLGSATIRTPHNRSNSFRCALEDLPGPHLQTRSRLDHCYDRRRAIRDTYDRVVQFEEIGGIRKGSTSFVGRDNPLRLFDRMDYCICLGAGSVRRSKRRYPTSVVISLRCCSSVG